ncbi:DUF3093 domain-containing protein [Stackebrandtia soli]|uniref:DUF3093 domain-containing protein n=1 Tax=Stackebrandtia soli TaxID=1892856 RepID=UPI0039E84E8E
MAPVDRTAFVERLTVPWWVWPVGLAFATILAVEIGLGAPGLTTWLPFVVMIPAAVALMVWLGRLRVSVDAEHFRVDDAILPLSCVDRVDVLTGTELRDAITAQLHPLAFVVQRPWVRTAVRVWLDDPEDPTPYWIISTRHPERLRAALTAKSEEPAVRAS